MHYMHYMHTVHNGKAPMYTIMILLTSRLSDMTFSPPLHLIISIKYTVPKSAK